MVIITKNEALNIEACLRSVAFADEVVVLDSGSTDGTAELARALGAKVAVCADWPGFGLQKNRALALATSDWVLSLDADERVPQDLQDEIRHALAHPSATTCAFEIPRLTQFCGKWIYHCGWTPDHVLRLFRRGHAQFSNDLVHERVVLQNPALVPARFRCRLLHYSYPSPAHYWRKLEQYSQAWALQSQARGRSSSMGRAIASGAAAFTKSYFLRLGFLDGPMGFAVCAMQAQGAFGKHFTLYCLNQQNESETP